jgi:hypothetical protein
VSVMHEIKGGGDSIFDRHTVAFVSLYDQKTSCMPLQPFIVVK